MKENNEDADFRRRKEEDIVEEETEEYDVGNQNKDRKDQ